MSNSLILEKQLAALEKSSQVLADELQETFADYLKCLGTAVKKQLILASYYLCTQGYPERFLSLSLQERQDLQSAIRQSGRKAIQDLSILINLTLRNQADLANQAGLVAANSETETDQKNDDGDGDSLEDFLDETETEEEVDVGNLNCQFPGTETLQAGVLLKNPHHVFQWHITLEKGIQAILKTVSRQTNKALQIYKILPKNLTELTEIFLSDGLKKKSFLNLN